MITVETNLPARERGFLAGVFAFVLTAMELLSKPDGRRWYAKAVKRCFLIALFVLVVLLFGGAWLVSSIGTGWWSNVAAVLWVLAVLFLSGSLTVTLMGSLMGLVLDERELLSALSRTKVVAFKGAAWLDRRREYLAVARSLAVTLLGWPFFIVPALIPLGILLFAWAMGREAVTSATRILHQNGEKSAFETSNTPNAFALGIAIIPAVCAFVPVLGWALWPALLASAVRGSRVADSGVEQVFDR